MRLLATDIVTPPFVPSPDTTAAPEAPEPAADAAVRPTLADGVVVLRREDPALRAPSTWDRCALAWIRTRGTRWGGRVRPKKGDDDTPGVLLRGTEVACRVDGAAGLSNDWIVTFEEA